MPKAATCDRPYIAFAIDHIEAALDAARYEQLRAGL
jgi:hypothetical protein